MSDPSDLLHDLVRDEHVGPPPLAELLAERRRSRRGAAAVVAVSLALVLVAAALTLARSTTTTSSPPPAETPPPGKTDGWSRLPDLPLSPRHGVLAAWLGDAAVFVGGDDAGYAPSSGADLTDGAAYDPVTAAWRPISPAPLPVGTDTYATVTGDLLLVHPPRGGWISYDAGDDSWRRYGESPQPLQQPTTTVLDGKLYILDLYSDEAPGPVQVLDLSTGAWSLLPEAPFDPVLDDRTIVATDHQIVVLGTNLLTAGGKRVTAGETVDIWDGTSWRRIPEAEVNGSGWQWDGHQVVPAVRAIDDPRNRNPQYPTGTLDPASGTWTTHGFGPLDSMYTSFGPTAIAPVESRTLAAGYLHDLTTDTWTGIPMLPPGTVGGATSVLTPDGILVLAADTPPPPTRSGPPVANMGPVEAHDTPQLWGLALRNPTASSTTPTGTPTPPVTTVDVTAPGVVPTAWSG